MGTAHIAHAARDHDGLVITTRAVLRITRAGLLEAAEIAADVRPAEFIVERRAADRALDHDVERGDDAIRLAQVFRNRALFPRLLEARNAQVRHRESGQSGFRLGTAPGGAFVAD